MKKSVYIILILAVGIVFTACEDELLDRTPLDQISDPDFWKGESYSVCDSPPNSPAQLLGLSLLTYLMINSHSQLNRGRGGAS